MRSKTAISTLLFLLLYGVALCNNESRDSTKPGRTNGPLLWPEDASYCSGRRNGAYPAKELCASRFVSCWDGVFSKAECPNGLVFNAETSQCDFKENVLSCRNPFNCTGRKDGAYANGCTSVFWYCSGGSVSLSRCQHGTYFDIESLRCEYKEDVPACGSKHLPESYDAKAKIATGTAPTTAFPVKFDGSGKVLCPEDGTFGLDCNRTFWICTDGYAVKRTCPQGLVFDMGVSRCAYIENVSGCTHLVKPRRASERLHQGEFAFKDNSTSSPDFAQTFPTYTVSLTPTLPTPTIPTEKTHPVPSSTKPVSEPEGPFGALKSQGRRISHEFMEKYAEQPVCKERADGRYFISSCSNKCLLCMEGKGVIVRCAQGQVFSRHMKQCVPISEEPECATTTASPVEEHSHPETAEFSSTLSVPEGHSRASCAMLPDGPHELLGCHEKFIHCANGVTSISSCAAGLVFNSRRGQCDYPKNTPSCGHGTGTKTIGAVSTPVVEEQSTLPSEASDQLHENKCAGRLNGLYADDCSEQYYACSNGLMSSFVCPVGLVFNVDTKYCDYRNYVKVCGGKSREATASAPIIPPFTHMRPTWSTRIPFMSRKQAPIIAAATTESHPVSGCSVLKDGLYSLQPCSATYFHCWKGATSLAKCAHGLVFNPDASRCDFRQSNRHCSEYVTHDGIKTTLAAPASSAQVSICEGRADGLYAEGCGARYFACSNGVASFMSCSAGLAFDVRSGLCDYPEKVAACIGAQSEAASAATKPITAAVMARPPSGCSVLPNGLHPLGDCLSSYMVCHEGTTRVSTCSPGLIFNDESSLCDFREKVKKCVDVPPRPMEDATCFNKPDGVFSSKCSASYVVCAKGTTYSFSCPNGLVYSAERASCDYSANVPTCLGDSPTTTGRVLTLPTTKSFVQDLDASRPVATDGNDDCVNKPDGNYAERSCAPTFYACANGVRTPLSCPASLVFNSEVRRCDYPEKVEACGSDETGTTHPPTSTVFITPAPNSRPSSDAMAIGTQSCDNSPDGVYAIRHCSNDFVYCLSGHSIVQKCPKGQVFDAGRKVCEHSSECDDVDAVVRMGDTKSASSYHQIKNAEPSCQGRRNGAYPMGHCSNRFFHCFSESMSVEFCPHGLVFNDLAGRCDYPSEGCDISEISAKARHVKPTVTTIPAQQHLDVKVDCASLPNGDYAASCTVEFVSCHNGIAEERRCPSGLVFDKTVKLCVWPEHCSPSHAPSDAFQSQSSAVPGTVASAASQDGDLDCSRLPDGHYSTGCTAEYTSCANGVKTTRSCPVGLVFDSVGRECVWPDQCATGERPTHAQPTSEESVVRVPTRAPELSTFQVEMDCSRLPDGAYGSGCSPTFTLCSDGESYLRKCPLGLLFDGVKKRCEYPDKACAKASMSSRAPASVAAPSPPLAAVSSPAAATTEHDHIIKQSEPPVNCATLPDGLYGKACETSFILCSNGLSVVRKCPHGLVYSPKFLRCEFPSAMCDSRAPSMSSPNQGGVVIECAELEEGDYSVGCTPDYVSCVDRFGVKRRCNDGLVFSAVSKQCVSPEHCTSSKVIESPMTTAIAAEAVRHTAHSGPIDCSTLSDGLYGEECSASFVICSNGVSVIHKCPYGLVYSPSVSRCAYPSARCSSSSTPFVLKPALMATHASSGSDICSSKADGVHGTHCADEYTRCSNGHAFTMKCPAGLVFSPKAAACELPSPECSSKSIQGVMPPVASADQTLTQVIGIHSSGVVDCSTRPDGVYGSACATTFVQCSNSKAHLMQCPTGLVFNATASRCDFIGGDCITSQDSSTAHPLPAAPAPPTSKPVQRQHSTDAVDCSSSPDGVYGTACANSFVYCSNGRAHTAYCPAGLVFNVRISQCDFPSPECGIANAPTYVPTLTTPAIASNAPTTSRHSPEASVDCSLLQDGVYGGECSATFTQCSSGGAFVMFCPMGLVFDPVLSQCDYPKQRCQALSVSVAPSVRPLVKATQTPALQHIVPASVVDCAKLPTGDYSLGCFAEYFTCLDGVELRRRCPQRLVFSEAKHRCVVPGDCTDVSTHIVTNTVAVPASTPANDVPSVKGPFDCSALSNGLYGDPCSRLFVQCSNGQASVFSCPASLVFFPQTQRCGYPMGDCAQMQSNPQSASPSASFQPPQQEAAVQTGGKVDCSGLPDGDYSTGCATTYVTCIGGVRHIRQCPASLVYNSLMRQCVWPEHCSAADGQVMATVPYASESPLPAGPIDCTIVKNGVFGVACSDSYVECSRDRAFIIKCAAGLVFSPKRRRCEHPTEECVPSTTTSTLSSASPTSHSSSPPGSDVDCSHLEDGDYSLGCSTSYVTCGNGIKHKRYCPSALVFDPSRKRCVHHEQCGSAVMQQPINLSPSRPTYANASPLPVGPIDCQARRDGVYGTACSTSFVQCSNGQPSVLHCPGGLVFIPEASRCEYRTEACGAHTHPLLAEQLAETPQQPADVINCGSLADGEYSRSCTRSYVECSNGRQYNRECPSGLLFHPLRQRCVYAENCLITNDEVAHTTSTTISLPLDGEKVDCSKESDGVFGANCSPSFLECSNGRASVLYCPATLVFSSRTHRCEYPTGECATTASDASPKLSNAFEPDQHLGEIDCATRPNGVYGVTCSATFVECWDSRAFLMRCSTGLVFNVETARCEIPMQECVPPDTVPTQSVDAPTAKQPAAEPFVPGRFHLTM
uniref:Chondroitin proteoglycan 2 n=1 Tax=Ascaris suum TaxID=6253 RepID=F1KPH8_ASCSU